MENDYLIDDEQSLDKRRPGFLTLACVVAGITAVYYLVILILNIKEILFEQSSVGIWPILYLMLVIAAKTAGVIGIWNMKRWAVILSICWFVFNQLILLASNSWHASSLSSLINISILLCYLKRMD